MKKINIIVAVIFTFFLAAINLANASDEYGKIKIEIEASTPFEKVGISNFERKILETDMKNKGLTSKADVLIQIRSFVKSRIGDIYEVRVTILTENKILVGTDQAAKEHVENFFLDCIRRALSDAVQEENNRGFD